MEVNANRQTVLVVDDLADNISLLATILSPLYRVKAANTASKALNIALNTPPDLILLDIMMPDMNGYEVCRRLKNEIRTSTIPVIFITAMNSIKDEEIGLAMGAVDYITKPISPPIVLARIKTHLKLYDQNRELEEKVRQRTAELDLNRLEIIRRLGRAAEYKDNETGTHVIRMSYYVQIISRSMGLSEKESDLLFKAAPMHDIGKIGIPDSILQKPGKLTMEERRIMERHTLIGAEIIGEHSDELLKTARTVALTHHEKWDGRGYPYCLSAERIPVEGRIVAIADVFDALTSTRPYKDAWPFEKAVDMIKTESGKHFDPGVVSAFLASLSEISDIKSEHSEKEPTDIVTHFPGGGS